MSGHLRELRSVLAAALVAATLAACTSTAPARYEADPDADLDALKRFAWHATPRPAATPLDSEILRKRVRAIATETLTGRGYAHDEAAPEFRLRAHLVVKPNAKAAPRLSIGLGTGSYGGSFGSSVAVGGSTEVGKAKDALTLVIEIRDAKSDELLWQGWREVGKGLNDPEQPTLADAVRAILGDFPRGADRRKR